MRKRLLSVAVLFHEALQRIGLFERVQIGSLQVFEQLHLRSLFGGQVHHAAGHLFQPSDLGSAQPAFACDEHIIAAPLTFKGTHHERLQHSVLLEACRQFVELHFVESLADVVVDQYRVNR